MRAASVWLVDGRHWPDHILAPWLACLTEAEQQRYRRFIRPMRQREFLIGRILLRFAVARLANLAFTDIGVVDRKDNAPLPVLPDRLSKEIIDLPFLSLSHSRGWVACAVSVDTPLGLDIEALDASRDVTSLGDIAFTCAENQWLSQHKDAEKKAAFYALWSEREALYKMRSSADRPWSEDALVSDGIKLTSGSDWTLYSPLHSKLAICLCSRYAVSKPLLLELTGDSPFAWALQADGLPETDVSFNQAFTQPFQALPTVLH